MAITMALPGGNSGTQIRQDQRTQGEARNGGNEKRHAAQRPLEKEGNEPQAGDRHRLVRGAPCRRQGAEEKVLARPARVMVRAPETGSSGFTMANKGRRLLIADDNSDAAESLAMLLRFEGHEVTA